MPAITRSAKRAAFCGLILAVLLSFLPGCSRRPKLPAGAPVVLICIDTLRSDHLPAYGYKKIATPELDRLAQDSIIFERVYSHVPLTLPSHVSLFTGQLPPETGVRNNRGYVLGDKPATLAEKFRAKGYRTAGFVSSLVLAAPTGISRGFEVYDDRIDLPAGKEASEMGFPRRAGEVTLKAAQSWLDSQSNGSFFLFFHIYEPHAPYLPLEPWKSRYPMRYDALIAQSDDLVGKLIDTLRRKGLYDQALVLFLSDHGEGLREHGEQQHGLTLYREALQVPLFVKLPGASRAGERIAAPAGLVDVAATIADMARLEMPEIFGRSLVDPPPEAPRPIYAETLSPNEGYGLSELYSIIDYPRHYIDCPRPELYDLARDPQEKQDQLRGAHGPKEMIEFLRLIGPGEFNEQEARTEDIERLASLGYFGGLKRGASNKDPKDYLPRIEELWSAVEKVDGKAGAAAAAQIPGLLDKAAVTNEVVIRTVAKRLFNAGRLEAAYEVAQRLRGSETGRSRIQLGEVASALDKNAEALAEFRAGLALDPRDPRGYLGIGLLALKDGKLAPATQWLRKAVELDPRLSEAWNGLGVIEARSERFPAALEAWQKAVDLDPQLADAWFNLALIRYKTGDGSGAVAALDRYIPLAGPDDREKAMAMRRELTPESSARSGSGVGRK